MSQDKYIIFNVSEISKIDFTQVLEDSSETLRKSLDGTLTFIRWNTETYPSFLQNLTSYQGPYSSLEIINLLNSSVWIDPNNSIY